MKVLCLSICMILIFFSSLKWCIKLNQIAKTSFSFVWVGLISDVVSPFFVIFIHFNSSWIVPFKLHHSGPFWGCKEWDETNVNIFVIWMISSKGLKRFWVLHLLAKMFICWDFSKHFWTSHYYKIAAIDCEFHLTNLSGWKLTCS